MTQYRHLYWDSGNSDLRMYSDSQLEVLSYFLRKRYAALLDAGTDYPGEVKTSQPTNFVSIGTFLSFHNRLLNVGDCTHLRTTSSM